MTVWQQQLIGDNVSAGEAVGKRNKRGGDAGEVAFTMRIVQRSEGGGGGTAPRERLGGDALPHRSAGEGTGWEGGASRPGEPGGEGRKRRREGGEKGFHTMEACFGRFSTQWKDVSGRFSMVWKSGGRPAWGGAGRRSEK